MTEAEWLGCTDPQKMVRHLSRRGSARKLRLFACACCRRIWALLPGRRSRRAVEVTEDFAEGLVTGEALLIAWDAALGGKRRPARAARGAPAKGQAGDAGCAALGAAYGGGGRTDAWRSAVNAAYHAARAVNVRARGPGADAGAAERSWQAALLRDIFGAPFRPVTADPAWLTPDVQTLAQAAYDQRVLPGGTLEAARLALLADALEDAGCASADLLGHLRSPGPHVRGCWALDLLTGRQ